MPPKRQQTKKKKRQQERFPPRWVGNFMHMMTRTCVYGFTISPPVIGKEKFNAIVDELIQLLLDTHFVFVIEVANSNRLHIHGAFTCNPKQERIDTLYRIKEMAESHSSFFNCRLRKDGQYAYCNSGWYSYMMKDLDKAVMQLSCAVVNNRNYSDWYSIYGPSSIVTTVSAPALLEPSASFVEDVDDDCKGKGLIDRDVDEENNIDN